MIVKFGEKCSPTPLSEDNLNTFYHNYMCIYNITKNFPVRVYTVFTPKHSKYGKAIILSDDEKTLIAKCSGNGLVSIIDNDLFNLYFKVDRLNPDEAEQGWCAIVALFKKMGVFRSIQRFSLSEFLSTHQLNACIKASREQDYFLSEMLGNSCSSKEIGISRVIALSDNVFFEQVNFNVFKSFKIDIRPLAGKTKVSFSLKMFTAYALFTNDHLDNIETIMKKLIKSYFDKKSVYMELDYILTPEFFTECTFISSMIEY